MTGKGVFFSISEAPSPMRRANRFPMGHLDAAEFSRNAIQREERGHYPSVMSVTTVMTLSLQTQGASARAGTAEDNRHYCYRGGQQICNPVSVSVGIKCILSWLSGFMAASSVLRNDVYQYQESSKIMNFVQH